MKDGLRETVFRRDGGCVLAKLEPGHECRDVWGARHLPTELWRLTLEHVKDELRMGVRAPSDEAHMVALCGYANNRPPTKKQRALMRIYLASLPANVHEAHVDPCGPDCRVGIPA